jgi:glycosyltransferase involved in cell wall biosynthesis
MNLLFLCPSFPPSRGGIEALMDDLSGLLAARGHGVTVLTGTPASAAAGPERRGVRVIRVRYPRRGRGVLGGLAALVRRGAMAWHHLRVIRRCRADTVCVGYFSLTAAYVMFARLFLRFRLVLYLHGSETRTFRQQSRLLRWAFVHALRRCDAVIAVSEDLRREALALAPCIRHKAVVIPNGIDVAALQRQAAAGPPGRFFLFAGRLEPVKNVGLLLRAFARASGAVPDLRLVVAGTGSLERDLKALADSLGLGQKVVFTGALEREAVNGLLKKAEFVVLPSWTEGHPIILLEALVAGRWVLASNVPGNRDLVEPGRNGDLFAPDDEDQLAGLIVDLASGAGPPRAAGGAGGLGLERFDLEKLADRHLHVFVGNGRRPGPPGRS